METEDNVPLPSLLACLLGAASKAAQNGVRLYKISKSFRDQTFGEGEQTNPNVSSPDGGASTTPPAPVADAGGGAHAHATADNGSTNDATDHYHKRSRGDDKTRWNE